MARQEDSYITVIPVHQRRIIYVSGKYVSGKADIPDFSCAPEKYAPLIGNCELLLSEDLTRESLEFIIDDIRRQIKIIEELEDEAADTSDEAADTSEFSLYIPDAVYYLESVDEDGTKKYLIASEYFQQQLKLKLQEFLDRNRDDVTEEGKALNAKVNEIISLIERDEFIYDLGIEPCQDTLPEEIEIEGKSEKCGEIFLYEIPSRYDNPMLNSIVGMFSDCIQLMGELSSAGQETEEIIAILCDYLERLDEITQYEADTNFLNLNRYPQLQGTFIPEIIYVRYREKKDKIAFICASAYLSRQLELFLDNIDDKKDFMDRIDEKIKKLESLENFSKCFGEEYTPIPGVVEQLKNVHHYLSGHLSDSLK